MSEDIKHLYGTLFLVKFDKLKLPEKSEDEDKGYQFLNPRTITDSGMEQAYDKKGMKGMRDSIRDVGLLNPLVCRWIDHEGEEVPQIVAGESRHRALSYLIGKKEKVKDPNSAVFDESKGRVEYSYRPANEVYEYIPCQIYQTEDDLQALELSTTENRVRTNLTEGHDVALVRELRECEVEDKVILKILGKEAAWLRDTDKLIEGLDHDTLVALCENRIKREAAKKLLAFDDEEVRQKVLARAIEISEEVAREQITKLDDFIENAEEDAEIATGSVAVARLVDDDEKVEKAEEALAKAEDRIERGEKAKKKVRAVAKSKQVDQAAGEVTGKKPEKCLREPKIRKHYLEVLRPMASSDKASGACHESGGFIYSVQHMQLALALIQGILEGNTDMYGILKKFYKKPTVEDVVLQEEVPEDLGDEDDFQISEDDFDEDDFDEDEDDEE